MKMKDTTLYASGTALAVLVSIVALLAPHRAMEADNVPTPVVSGTELPAMLNSPETHCGDHRCADSEFDSLINDLQTQWSLTPDWIRAKCVDNSSVPTMERCILKQTEDWILQNPNRKAPWANPRNVGSIVRAGK
jgi:hypothetical protein